MTEAIVCMRGIGYIIIVACLAVVAIKVVWNLGLPYAMIREHAKGVRRAWSVFPAIEVIPLLIAIGLSYLVPGPWFLSPRTLAIYGFAVVVASYLHFSIVAMVYGLRRKHRERGNQ